MLLTSLQLFAQSTSAAPKKKGVLPETLVNLELQSEILGTGFDYSGGGIKAMIGSKNTGILLGFINGSSTSDTYKYNSFRLGYQYGIVSGFYANANLDLASIKSIYLYEPRYRSIRVNLGIGYTLSFGKKKRLYYNIETAIAAINTSFLPRFAIYSGIGFRLGTPAKTSFDGIKEVNTVPVKL